MTKEEMPSGRKPSGLAVARHVRLVWRLLTDSRVSPWLKAVIPGLALAYLILPTDLIPDWIIGLGQLDDLALLLLAIQLFVELCPKSIVEELSRGVPAGPSTESSTDEVIDASYRVIEEEDV